MVKFGSSCLSSVSESGTVDESWWTSSVELDRHTAKEGEEEEEGEREKDRVAGMPSPLL